MTVSDTLPVSCDSVQPRILTSKRHRYPRDCPPSTLQPPGELVAMTMDGSHEGAPIYTASFGWAALTGLDHLGELDQPTGTNPC